MIKRSIVAMTIVVLLLVLIGCARDQDRIYEDMSPQATATNVPTNEPTAGAANPTALADEPGTTITPAATPDTSSHAVDTALSGRFTYWTDYLHGGMLRQFAEFSEAFPNVELEYIGLTNESTDEWLDKAAQMSVQIMSGNGPDVIKGSVSLPVAKYAKNGYLVDFNELMANDPNFLREDYYTDILDAMQTSDGKLYRMPIAAVPVLVVLNRPVLAAIGVDVDDYTEVTMLQLLDWHKQIVDAGVFNDPSYKESFYQALLSDQSRRYRNWEFPQQLLKEFDNYFKDDTFYFTGYPYPDYYRLNLLDIVYRGAMDIQNGTADFGRPDIVSFLRQSKDMQIQTSPDDYGNIIILPNELCMINTYMDKDYLNAYLRTYDMSSSKIPLVDESGRKIIDVVDFVIPTTSKNIPLAWEFIKFIIEDKQLDDAKLSAYPANSDFFPVRTDYDGIPINRNNSRAVISYYTENEAFADTVEAWVTTPGSPHWTDTGISPILTDVASEYYDGLIDLEQCVKKLNERAEMYLGE